MPPSITLSTFHVDRPPDHLALTPTGSHLARTEDRSDHAVAVHDLSAGEDAPVVARYGAGRGRGVAFAESVLYFLDDQDGRVELCGVDLRDGSTQHVADYGASEQMNDLIADEKGRLLAVLGTAAEVWRLDTHSVIRRRERDASAPGALRGAFSPDARRLYLYGDDPSHGTVLDIPDNRVVQTYPVPSAEGLHVCVAPDERHVAFVSQHGAYVYSCFPDEGRAERCLTTFFNDNWGGGMHKAIFASPAVVLDPSGAYALDTESPHDIPAPPRGRTACAAVAPHAGVVAFANRSGDVFWYSVSN